MDLPQMPYGLVAQVTPKSGNRDGAENCFFKRSFLRLVCAFYAGVEY